MPAKAKARFKAGKELAAAEKGEYGVKQESTTAPKKKVVNKLRTKA